MKDTWMCSTNLDLPPKGSFFILTNNKDNSSFQQRFVNDANPEESHLICDSLFK